MQPPGRYPRGVAEDPSTDASTPPPSATRATPSRPRRARRLTPGSPRRSRAGLLAGVALGVLTLDVVTKVLAATFIEPAENIRILGGLVYLTNYRNTGAAFSFAEGATVVFSLIAVVVVVVIMRVARRLLSTGWAVALGLVLGGALGNLVDRVFRDPGFLRGGVVDFISLLEPDGGFYPIFNMADPAIVCGGILGAVLAVRGIEFDGSRTKGAQGRSDDGPAEGPVAG